MKFSVACSGTHRLYGGAAPAHERATLSRATLEAKHLRSVCAACELTARAEQWHRDLPMRLPSKPSACQCQRSQLQRHAFLRSTADQSLGGTVEVIGLQVQLGQWGTDQIKPPSESRKCTRPASASSGQLRPAPASSGQLRPAPASSGQLRPASASSGQLRPAPASSGRGSPRANACIAHGFRS